MSGTLVAEVFQWKSMLGLQNLHKGMTQENGNGKYISKAAILGVAGTLLLGTVIYIYTSNVTAQAQRDEMQDEQIEGVSKQIADISKNLVSIGNSVTRVETKLENLERFLKR